MNRVIVRVDAEGKPLPRTEDQLCCWEVKQSSILFNEKLYAKRRGRFDSNVQGFSISKKKPLFVYHIEDTKERKEDLEQAPHQKIVEVFIMKIINRIKLSNEVCLLSLIFIERLAVSVKMLFISCLEKRGSANLILQLETHLLYSDSNRSQVLGRYEVS